jgi:hypothetical protein
MGVLNFSLLPLENRSNIADQIIRNRNALVVLFNRLMDTTTQISSLLDLLEGLFNDTVSKIIIRLAFGSIETHGRKRIALECKSNPGRDTEKTEAICELLAKHLDATVHIVVPFTDDTSTAVTRLNVTPLNELSKELYSAEFHTHKEDT